MSICVFCGENEATEGSKICNNCALKQGREETLGKIRASLTEQRETERSLSCNKNLVESYKVFERELNPDLKLIYYPACSTDISPSKAFTESRIIYVDTDKRAVDALQEAEYEAIEADANNFYLESSVGTKADAVILLNPSGVEETSTLENLKAGGFVICNDYHDSASIIRENDNFELLGIIRKNTETGEFILDKDKPELYWQTVETDEECKAASPYFFQQFKKIVENTPGAKGGSIVDKYRQIYQENYDETVGMSKGKDGAIFFALPRKKGHMDDLFVFQHKKMEPNR